LAARHGISVLPATRDTQVATAFSATACAIWPVKLSILPPGRFSTIELGTRFFPRFLGTGQRTKRCPAVTFKTPWTAGYRKLSAKGDEMDTNTLLIILIVIFLVGGGGWYGRGRWF
jgi:hypothetical protein